MEKENIKQQILNLVEQYSALQYADKPFTAGTSVVPPSGKVIGAPELKNMVEASLDGWLTTGRFNEAFEQRYGQAADLIEAQRKVNENRDVFRAMRRSRQGLAMYEREP